MKNRIYFVIIVSLFVIAPLSLYSEPLEIDGSDSEVTEVVETDLQAETSDTNKETVNPEDFSIRWRVWLFMKNPKGLEVDLGYGVMMYRNLMLETAYKDLSAIDKLLYDANIELQYFRFGVEIGHSFVTGRISPNMPGSTNLFYMEVESGVWLYNRRELKKGLTANSGFYFFGSVLSFSEPIIDPADVKNYNPFDVQAFNSGLGMAIVGSAIPATLDLNIANIVYVSIGAYLKLSIVLPYYVNLVYGIIGPDIKIFVVPNKLAIYFNMRPYRNTEDMSYMEGGLKWAF